MLCLQTDRSEELGATFALEHEDHTLVNALRFFLNKKCAVPGRSLAAPVCDTVNSVQEPNWPSLLTLEEMYGARRIHC